VTDIAEGRPPEPSFDDGLQVQQVLHAVERSAAGNGILTSVAEASAAAIDAAFSVKETTVD
jgi:hypothetical protein